MFERKFTSIACELSGSAGQGKNHIRSGSGIKISRRSVENERARPLNVSAGGNLSGKNAAALRKKPVRRNRKAAFRKRFAPKIGSHGNSAVNGASLVSYVFGQCFGNFAGKLLAVMVLLFAFSTVIGWSFNGAKSAEYLFGTKSVPLYRAAYVAFVLLGSTVSLTLAWDISDTLNGLMAIPNLIGVLILSGNVSKELSRYLRERADLSSERKQCKSAEKTRRSR